MHYPASAVINICTIYIFPSLHLFLQILRVYMKQIQAQPYLNCKLFILFCVPAAVYVSSCLVHCFEVLASISK